MLKNKSVYNLLELNVAIILISTSGALGRYIDMSPPLTIAFRALLAGFFIFLFCKIKGFSFKIKKKDRATVIWSGLFMGLHWVTYFYSLKLSNVAIGMISLFTHPIITSLLEPLILKTRFQKMHVVLGALVLTGIYFLVPDFDFQNDYTKAIALGILSAVFYSLRNIIIKPKMSDYNGSIMMMYQLVVIAIFLSPSYLLFDTSGIIEQLPANLILALLTTTIGHTMFLYSFRHFSATSVGIMSSSQPIYGIIIGIIFLSEYPDLSSMIGGLFILTSVVLESIRTYKKKG